MKRVLIISTSPRKNGNSDSLCQKVAESAKGAGAEVEFIRTSDYDLHPCTACNGCIKTEDKCVIKDDMPVILDKMIKADVIVMATPLYYFSLSAQIKIVIDRTYSCYIKDKNPLENKKWYLIITAETTEESDLKTAVDSFKGFLRCVPGSTLQDVLYGTGTSISGKANSDKYFGQAEKMGKDAAAE